MNSTGPDNDFEKELRAHLELEAAEHSERGISARDAHDRARRAFGNVTFIAEDITCGPG